MGTDASKWQLLSSKRQKKYTILQNTAISQLQKIHIQHGTFVPAGIHLTTSPDTNKGLLCRQNQFIKSLISLSIERLLENEIYQDIMIENTVTNIGEYIMSHKGIKALERTNKTDEIGKWFLLYTHKAKKNSR